MKKKNKRTFFTTFISVLAAGILIICVFCLLLQGSEEVKEDEPQMAEDAADDTETALSEETEFAAAEKEPTVILEPEPEPEPEKTEEELLEEQVDLALQQMTLEEKVLQLFIITPEALTGSDAVTAAGDTTKDSIRQYPVGGLVYFAHNLKSPEQVREMLANTRTFYEEAEYPVPFLSLDEEGGKVARIGSQPAFGVERFSDMAEVGRTGDTGEAERIGSVIGNYLADLGFNLDFAPDADVLTNPDNQVVKNRSFGSDPQLVADMALAEVKGMEENGVYATLKHYPGHGATLGDTHAGYAYTDKALEEMMEAELVPFIAGIQEGIHFIMVAHISAPAVTGDETPCSMSQYMITEVLRNQLGYDGIVITDAMNMGAISQQYTSADGAVGALKAGVDIVLMPSDFHGAYEGVLAAVQAGELTEERINESVRRILRVKCGM